MGEKCESVRFVQVTLLGLWMIPAFYSFELEFWRFLIVRQILTLSLTLLFKIWSLYSLVTGYGLISCLSKNLSSLTPRIVSLLLVTLLKCEIGLHLVLCCVQMQCSDWSDRVCDTCT